MDWLTARACDPFREPAAQRGRFGLNRVAVHVRGGLLAGGRPGEALDEGLGLHSF